VYTASKEKIEWLQSQLMGPRMERLRAIEQDIKSRVEEWALAEEKTEVNNIVPVFVAY